MFERFTDEARHAVVLAQTEARQLNHSVLGSEHLLLALTEPGTPMSATLAEHGVTDSHVREAVRSLRPAAPGFASTSLPFTPNLKRVIEMSIREALRMALAYVGPEHLLLGLLRVENTTAHEILLSLGASPDVIAESLRGATTPVASGESESLPDHPSRSGSSSQLDKVGTNLNLRAERGEIDPVIGRAIEISRVVQILARRTKNNPVLIGEPGVGKTAIAEGLASMIVAGDVPELLRDKVVYSLDMGALVSGTRYRGDFEERIKAVLDEVKKRKNIILFIDEIHTLVGAGSGDSSAMDAANLFKPLLARGELQVVGATTFDEFRKHIEKDAALARRMQQVVVNEPSVTDTVAILGGLRQRYEEFHDVTITDEALEAAARLAKRYIPERQLPDTAIDLVDEAGARIRVAAPEDRTVTPELIEHIIAAAKGLPVGQLNQADLTKMADIELVLNQQVIGQAGAISALSRAVRRARAGLSDPRRPQGSFIFAGPTGVGKTECAKALTRYLFGSEDALITVDMSEYGEKHAVSRLFGAPPGYVGFDEGGQLTEKVRRRPHSVILFDEVEKAHPDIFNSLLQVLEEGRLTDSAGRIVDFRNTVIILTTNLGSEVLKNGALGFGGGDQNDRTTAVVQKALKDSFRPEFLNRIDETVVFGTLTPVDVQSIVSLLLLRLEVQLHEKGLQLDVTPDALALLATRGYDPSMGARPLRRVIQRQVEDKLAEFIIAGQCPEGASVIVDATTDDIAIRVTMPALEGARPNTASI